MKANTERLYKDVQFLTEISPSRNYLNLDSLTRVVIYIKKEFEEIGVSSVEQKWMAEKNEYSNLIASYEPLKPKRLIVGAHYDVCGDQPGADDNASAVAGLMETARMILKNKPELDYGIDFVAYCLEEPPFFGSELMGSYVHAKSLKDDNVEVIGMICYEMIGYFSDEPNSQNFPSPELEALYPNVANFIIVVGIDEYQEFNSKVHRLMAKDSGIDVQLINFPGSSGLAGLSDHRNYWTFAYPALMINDTSFIWSPNYHEKSDTIETLDFGKMTEVINSSYRAIVNLND